MLNWNFNGPFWDVQIMPKGNKAIHPDMYGGGFAEQHTFLALVIANKADIGLLCPLAWMWFHSSKQIPSNAMGQRMKLYHLTHVSALALPIAYSSAFLVLDSSFALRLFTNDVNRHSSEKHWVTLGSFRDIMLSLSDLSLGEVNLQQGNKHPSTLIYIKL